MAAKETVTYLQDCARLTGAAWAIWLQQDAADWVVQDSYGLEIDGLNACLNWAKQSAGPNWLNRVTGSRRVLSRSVDQRSLGCRRVYALGGTHASHILLVGAVELDKVAQRVWRLATYGLDQLARRGALEEELQNTQQELQARIAAQAAAEQRLIQAAKLAAVGEMAAGVAHELNNPLTTIVGFTELVLEDLSPKSPIRSDLETVLREALRARDVVRHLLDFSRGSELVRSKCDVNELVLDTLGLMRHMLSNRGVQVHTDLPESLPWVYLDRDQIKQVILNLLHNALHAMPEGGRIDIVSARRKKYGADWISISVKDSGVGIPAENLDRIFEPFFTTHAAEGGTGLGLPVTYGIIASHGGRIEVESAPGAGANFTVWLPVEGPSQ